MVGRIVFGWLQGSNFDTNAKTWRFMADILNDIAMFLEMLVVPFPDYFLGLVCLGTAFVGFDRASMPFYHPELTVI